MVPKPQETKLDYEESDVLVDEQKVWSEMEPMAWHLSITRDTIFTETYEITRKQIAESAKHVGYDCIIECGCGTGEVIGELETDLPRYGVDINERFIDHCKEKYGCDGSQYDVVDILKLTEWWDPIKREKGYEKPLIVCVNNTLPIMPKEIRGKALDQMLEVAGPDGGCVVSLWNGHFFSHAVMNYYRKNVALCGPFSMSCVDWEGNKLETPSGYSTHWMTPKEVQHFLRSYDINITDMDDSMNPSRDHINTAGLGIFAWFSQGCTSRSKSYYDSDDAQTFYSSIWGEETVHVGRYDLLTDEDKSHLSYAGQISKAEELHELEFVKRIRCKYATATGQGGEISKMRILDMGCGYGGLLRRLWKEGLVWRGTGCDIANQMCEKARFQNAQVGCEKDISILEESYLGVSIGEESVDVVISMDAFLHIGPECHHAVMKEAYRVLRPGGWIIYCDIMEKEEVDSDEMRGIYDRINLRKLGTVSNYKEAVENAGFRKFEFECHSENVASHYGTVRKVLKEKGGSLCLSADFLERMSSGLEVWERLAPKNIVWGFMSAQKTEKMYS